MKALDVAAAIIIVAIIALGYWFYQNSGEEVFYSESPPVQPEADSLETPVPLIEKNARWGKGALNVFIYIDASREVPGFRQEFVERFQEAAQTLSNSIDGKITFRFVSQAPDADIFVRWVSQLRAESLDAIGHTELNFSIAPSYSVITLAEVELLAEKDGEVLSGDQTLALSLHELGHAIGLGHSDSKESMMYPEAQSITVPSQVDVQSILETYALPALPDLYVREAEFSKRVVSRAIFKQYLYDGRIVIINDGLSASGPFAFSVETGKDVLEESAKSLSPGESIILTLANVSTEQDFSVISVYIDKENRIKELNEDNLYRVEVG